jgi:metal transporter CNNM
VDIAEDSEASRPVVGSLGAMSDGSPERFAKTATFMRRRGSAGLDGKSDDRPVPFKASLDEMKQQLRHLAPSNRAANPRNTRTNVFKIKQGLSVTTFVAGDGNSKPLDDPLHRLDDGADGDETTPLLDTSDLNGVQPRNGYGSGKSKKRDDQTRSPDHQ